MNSIGKAQIREAIEGIALNSALTHKDVTGLVAMFPGPDAGSPERAKDCWRGAVEFLYLTKISYKTRNQLLDLLD